MTNFPNRQEARTVYEISILSETEECVHFHTFTQERKEDALATPQKGFDLKSVRFYIDKLIHDGFFNVPKTALHVLTKCRAGFGEDFHPRYMIKTLIDFCDGRKGKKLDDNGKNDCGRRVYSAK